MRINLQDFQSSMEKKEYLEKKIESKEFLNDDVSMQINTLKYVVELIKIKFIKIIVILCKMI